jgi:hypothetical protein
MDDGEWMMVNGNACGNLIIEIYGHSSFPGKSVGADRCSIPKI